MVRSNDPMEGGDRAMQDAKAERGSSRGRIFRQIVDNKISKWLVGRSWVDKVMR